MCRILSVKCRWIPIQPGWCDVIHVSRQPLQEGKIWTNNMCLPGDCTLYVPYLDCPRDIGHPKHVKRLSPWAVIFPPDYLRCVLGFVCLCSIIGSVLFRSALLISVHIFAKFSDWTNERTQMKPSTASETDLDCHCQSEQDSLVTTWPNECWDTGILLGTTTLDGKHWPRANRSLILEPLCVFSPF